MLGKIKAIFQIILPKQLLTHCFGWLADRQWGFFTQWMIKLFIKIYRVNMDEALHEETKDYKTFNDFFSRKLKEDARSFNDDEREVIIPADGRMSEFGSIHEGYLFQAKGHTYCLESLVASQMPLSHGLQDGKYVTIYLSPKDYHRVHMPCDAILREMVYVPGTLFSVSPAVTENIDSIFARNERIICVFDTDYGMMVQILVGATIVGSIVTTWQGQITPTRDGLIKHWDYSGLKIEFKKGEEMGGFKLGSTVITLFPKDSIVFDESLHIGKKVQLGETLGYRS